MIDNKTIIRVIKDKENPYMLLNTASLKDKNLTAKAKGIHIYILSLPDDWKIYTEELRKHFKDGRDSINSGIKELIDNGYMNRNRIQDDKGKFKGYEYLVYEIKQKVLKSVKPAKQVKPTRQSVNGKSVNGKTVNGKPAATNYLPKQNIDNTNYTTTDKNETNVVVDIFTITSFYDRIKNKIGVAVSKKAIEEMIQKKGGAEISKYIDNWDKFSGTKKKTVAGFFKNAVMDSYVIPKGDITSDGKPKEEWERPIESDDYYNSFCENGGSE